MSIIYINEQGAYLRKKAGRFVVTKKDDELFSVPEVSVDRVIIFGNVQISTQAVSDLLSNGVEVIYLSRNGKFKGILEPGFPKNVHVRMAQYEAALDDTFSLKVAQDLIKEKLKSEIFTIRKWEKNLWIDKSSICSEISRYSTMLESGTSIKNLLGVEAITAKTYYSVFPYAVPPPFCWNGRNRRPPKDPVNALLSLTYMMTFSEIVSECYSHALDPYIGFLHQLVYSRPSLAVDILEPLRALYCDHFVIKELQNETFNITDFSYKTETENSTVLFSDKSNFGQTVKISCLLTKEGFKKYIEKFDSFKNKSLRNKRSLKGAVRYIVKNIVYSIKERSPLDIGELF